MQLFQNQKQNIQSKFDQIDQRWTNVQQALRIQKQQRNQDVHALRQNLQQKINLTQTIQHSKNKIAKQNALILLSQAQTCKQNLKGLIQEQQQFRLRQVNKKNQFISNTVHNNEAFNKNICDKFTQKINQIRNNLNNNDQSVHKKTLEDVNQIRQQKIIPFRQFMDKQRQRLTIYLNKIKVDAGKQIDEMRVVLKEYCKKKEESDLKIQIMIQELACQLKAMQQNQWKEGQLTYQCLLKVLEDSCSKIQESQYR